MAQPQLKTGEIFDAIRGHQGTMDTFTFNRYLKEINSLKKHNAFDAYHLKGMLYSVYEPTNPTLALNNFAKAEHLVLSVHRPRFFANYSFAFFVYKKYDRAVDMACQAIQDSLATNNPEDELIQEVLSYALNKLLTAGQFTKVQQLIEQLMLPPNTPWYQQNSLAQFINQNKSPALLQELQTQQEIYQTVLAETDIKQVDYFVTPENDCIITLTLDTTPENLLELAEHQVEQMLEREFSPSKISLLLN